MNNRKKNLYFVYLLMSFWIISCSYTSSEFDDEERELKESSKKKNIEKIEYPAFEGVKTNVAVFPLGLSERTAKKYPHLLTQNVGLGLHNILSAEIGNTGRFEMIEIEDEAIQKIVKVQWLSSSGMVREDQMLETAQMMGVKKLVYGEVSDYAESKEESTILLSSSTKKSAKVALEIRLLDIEKNTYLNAYKTAYGFDWGNACEKAIKMAVKDLVEKLSKKETNKS